ncbi:T9SS type A sorting domain-containing protein [Flavisolibacter tropicus]|uniref:Secretion system C-terminal sorting domain-containing protein n=1 Tax=Flavisolibacter tropicus TaxID=1492898 RepID=A0A172TSN4_9BACT|nr:T9SS type A sorting domain-containing protein [Flavisolibacter tropicus]ANE50006.1 hypothetical protein SY85_05340 [Flavisolibacter tropicus]
MSRNPVVKDGIVSVTVPDVSSKPALTVFNVNGNAVRQTNVKANVTKLSVAGLASGVFYLT